MEYFGESLQRIKEGGIKFSVIHGGSKYGMEAFYESKEIRVEMARFNSLAKNKNSYLYKPNCQI